MGALQRLETPLLPGCNRKEGKAILVDKVLLKVNMISKKRRILRKLVHSKTSKYKTTIVGSILSQLDRIRCRLLMTTYLKGSKLLSPKATHLRFQAHTKDRDHINRVPTKLLKGKAMRKGKRKCKAFS